MEEGETFIKTCKNCGHIWKPIKENPNKCPKCKHKLNNSPLEYKNKYIKNPVVHQVVVVSDKTYSLLLRNQKYTGEKIRNVIQRSVFENTFSETVEYPDVRVTHQIEISTDLKMRLCEIANLYKITKFDEVIWRLSVNVSKKAKN